MGGTRPSRAGTFYVVAGAGAHAVLERAARELGVSVVPAPVAPGGQMRKLRVPRIGLWDRYGGSMPSGWIRWLLERFEYPVRGRVPADARCGQAEAPPSTC